MSFTRKAACLLFAAMLCMGVMAGCSAPKAEPTSAPTVAETETPEPIATVEVTATPEATEPAATETPAPESDDNLVPEGKSPTTGLDYEGEYLPIMVSIGNNDAARPQWGLSQADIVYEYLMEGQSITRYNAIFSDNKPEEVGPIRSCRVPFVNELASWQGMPLVFYGGNNASAPYNPYTRLEENGIDAVLQMDGLGGTYSKYFWRDPSRSAPHNVLVDLSRIAEEVELPAVERIKHFAFAEDAADALTEQALSLEVFFTPSSKKAFASFVYNEELGAYERYISGEKSEDHEGEQILANNVIIRYTEYSVYNVSPPMLDTEPVGSGDAEYYIGGKRMTGTWVRESLESPVVYLDSQGQEMVFQPGKTWIEMVRTGSTVAYE